jgi:hypothetical protein
MFGFLCRYSDAAAFHLRLGSAADKCNAINSQCKVIFALKFVYLFREFVLVIEGRKIMQWHLTIFLTNNTCYLVLEVYPYKYIFMCKIKMILDLGLFSYTASQIERQKCSFPKLFHVCRVI